MKKLILSVGLLVVCLALTFFAAHTKTWWFLILAAMWGYPTLFFAVQFGKEKSKKEWEGRGISEEDLPREIYQVVYLAMYDDYPIAILRSKDRKLITCISSFAVQGKFHNFLIRRGSEGTFFIPKELGNTPAAAED